MVAAEEVVEEDAGEVVGVVVVVAAEDLPAAIPLLWVVIAAGSSFLSDKLTAQALSIGEWR